jgi:hypothetical protein
VVTRELQERSKEAESAVLFIFCDYNDQMNQALSQSFGSLVKHLLSQCLSLPFTFPADASSTHLDTQMSLQLLQGTSASFKRVYIVVDELDE